jgi:hypothetical protein
LNRIKGAGIAKRTRQSEKFRLLDNIEKTVQLVLSLARLGNLHFILGSKEWSQCAEAWRRADAGELADEELYPSDAQWSGLYDRMHTHEPDEMERRLALAADYGEAV